VLQLNAAQVKRNVALQISKNPSTITITRTSYTDDGAGGKIKSTTTTKAQTVRIFMSASSEQQIVNEGGQIQVQQWGLLAKSDADIKQEDVFTFDSRTFRVRSILPARTGGQTVAFHVDLEEVR
jgi:hypothetical protein